MINRVVVPLDRSALSEAAIPFGVLLAGTLAASLDLVHVIEEHEDLRATGADIYLLEIVRRFPIPADHRALVRMGDAAERILDVTDGAGTMLVMATHGHGGLRRMLLGSVADTVVRKATVPVALIRGGENFRLPQQALAVLLVPLDGSERSMRALPVAIELASRSGARLHLLQVVMPISVSEIGYGTDTPSVSPGTYEEMMDELEGAARENLDLAARTCQSAGVDVTTQVVVGTPGDGILRTADGMGADIIIMATHGRGGARRLFFGSVATGVMQRSDIPVIVVPARAQIDLADVGGSQITRDQRDIEKVSGTP